VAYTVWERLVRADLGSDPADKAKVMEKAEERFILAQDDYELAKLAIILGRIPDWKAKPKLRAARRKQKLLSRNIFTRLAKL